MISVTQAVRQRHSVRAFLPDPVPLETVREILNVASRSPSGGNLQPWHVDVLAGAALEELKERARERLKAGLETPEFAVYPADIAELHETRRRQCGDDLYTSLGIERADKAARWSQFLRNYELFGAPAALFFSVDRRFDRPQWAHLGMFIQTIMLLAEERGLGTCAQESWAAMHLTVAEFLALPDDRILYCGLALGFEDKAHPVNGFRTTREAVDGFATFRGF
jgi:nitroreductase